MRHTEFCRMNYWEAAVLPVEPCSDLSLSSTPRIWNREAGDCGVILWLCVLVLLSSKGVGFKVRSGKGSAWRCPSTAVGIPWLFSEPYYFSWNERAPKRLFILPLMVFMIQSNLDSDNDSKVDVIVHMSVCEWLFVPWWTHDLSSMYPAIVPARRDELLISLNTNIKTKYYLLLLVLVVVVFIFQNHQSLTSSIFKTRVICWQPF